MKVLRFVMLISILLLISACANNTKRAHHVDWTEPAQKAGITLNSQNVEQYCEHLVKNVYVPINNTPAGRAKIKDECLWNIGIIPEGGTLKVPF